MVGVTEGQGRCNECVSTTDDDYVDDDSSGNQARCCVPEIFMLNACGFDVALYDGIVPSDFIFPVESKCSIETEYGIDAIQYETRQEEYDYDEACSVKTEPPYDDREEPPEELIEKSHDRNVHIVSIQADPLDISSTKKTRSVSPSVSHSPVGNKKKLKRDLLQNSLRPSADENITVGSNSSHNIPTSLVDEDNWTGFVVALCLPSSIDVNFDVKCKPIDRRVDPDKYLSIIEQHRLIAIEQFNNDNMQDSKVRVGGSGDDTGNVILNVYLSNDDGANDIKIRLIRNPNENIMKTLERLQLSVQKKVGSKTRKKKTRKGKDTLYDEEVLLMKKIQQEDEDDNQSVLHKVYDMIACAKYLTNPRWLNPCHPWNTWDELDVVTEQLIRSEYTDEVAGNDAIGSTVDEYEFVNIESITTLNEVLHRTMSVANLDNYALSVPVACNDHTSRIPIMIQSCLPTITRVSTFGSFHDTHVFENTPIVVEVDVLYSTDVLISWFADGQLVCANSSYYTPTSCDVNKVLTVVVVPHRPDHDGKGCEEAYQFKRRVMELPALPVIRPLREEFLNRPDSTQSLRVMTYNILADQNVARDFDKTDRMYSHCKDEYLIKWRRHPLIVHEILQYRSDIIAMQEVDADVYTDLLKPVMNAMGYEGYFSQKGVGATSGVQEGCVIFWSTRMFESVRPIDMQTRSYREMIQKFCHEEYLQKSHWKSMGDILQLLNKHNELKNVMFNKLGHVIQTVVLTHKQSQEKVVVGNTHLFYSPMANHIRCLQMLIACRQLEIEHGENQNCPVIFCGDLNSPPDSGVMKLMLDRNVDANVGKTWENLHLFEWEKGKGAGVQHDVHAIDLELPESFPSFSSAHHPSPEFTFYFKNDIEEFICTLDHILITSNFEVEMTGATPTRNEVERFISMPNVSMPSDHVSLVCDLKWK